MSSLHLLHFFKDHFEQSQFEEIARSPAGGKKLKPNAIPTLFNVGEPPYPAFTVPYILHPLKPEPGTGNLRCKVALDPLLLYSD